MTKSLLTKNYPSHQLEERAGLLKINYEDNGATSRSIFVLTWNKCSMFFHRFCYSFEGYMHLARL